MSTFNQETLSGSDCNGTEGEENRVLTLSNTGETETDKFKVYLDGLFLIENVGYTVSHNTLGTEINFLDPVWDDQKISVDYYQGVAETLYRDDLQGKIEENKQEFTLKRYTESVDTMGGVTSKTTESYTIYTVLINISKKDRKIHEMGLAVSGNMKALFYHEYPDSITGNGTLIVQVGDILEASDGKQWRIEAIPEERYVLGQEVFRTGVIRNINLEE